MNVQSYFAGETVNIVDVNVNGSSIYVTCIDSTSAVKVTTRMATYSLQSSAAPITTLGTSATIV